jgi:NADP-dependent 3-hydroxy acid dehydrogenase YdfG
MDNRVVMVLGGAGGIGQATSRYFYQCGWTVISLDKVYQEDQFLEQRLSQIHCDIANQASLDAVISLVSERFAKVNVVVNSVGLGCIGDIVDVPFSEVDLLFDVNVKGAINAFKSTINLLRRAKMGRYIQISSLAGMAVYPRSSVYCATKYAVEGFFGSLRFELINDDISVHLVRLGRTDSLFSHSLKEHYGNDEEQRLLIANVRHHFDSEVKKSIPVERVAKQIYQLATVENPPFSINGDRQTDFILKQRKKMTEDEWFDSVSKQFNL